MQSWEQLSYCARPSFQASGTGAELEEQSPPMGLSHQKVQKESIKQCGMNGRRKKPLVLTQMMTEALRDL